MSGGQDHSGQGGVPFSGGACLGGGFGQAHLPSGCGFGQAHLPSGGGFGQAHSMGGGFGQAHPMRGGFGQALSTGAQVPMQRNVEHAVDLPNLSARAAESQIHLENEDPAAVAPMSKKARSEEPAAAVENVVQVSRFKWADCDCKNTHSPFYAQILDIVRVVATGSPNIFIKGQMQGSWAEVYEDVITLDSDTYNLKKLPLKTLKNKFLEVMATCVREDKAANSTGNGME